MLARKSSAMSGRPEKSPTAEASASAPPRPSALPQVGAVAPKAPHGPWRPKSTGLSSSTSRAPNRGPNLDSFYIHGPKTMAIRPW